MKCPNAGDTGWPLVLDSLSTGSTVVAVDEPKNPKKEGGMERHRHERKRNEVSGVRASPEFSVRVRPKQARRTQRRHTPRSGK